MILLDDDADEGFRRLVLFEESLILDDARLARVRPDAQCHDEEQDHPWKVPTDGVMVYACKACKGVFRKDMRFFEKNDEYCPHCGNCYAVVIESVPDICVFEGGEKLGV